MCVERLQTEDIDKARLRYALCNDRPRNIRYKIWFQNVTYYVSI